MNKDTLILKDGTAIALETGASLGNLGVLFPDKQSMVETWSKLTEDNLSEVQVQNSAGLTVGRYKELVLVTETSAIQEDGYILTSFNFRKKDAAEKRMDAIEAGQEVQDGAIMDMAEIISTMAEQKGDEN